MFQPTNSSPTDCPSANNNISPTNLIYRITTGLVSARRPAGLSQWRGAMRTWDRSGPTLCPCCVPAGSPVAPIASQRGPGRPPSAAHSPPRAASPPVLLMSRRHTHRPLLMTSAAFLAVCLSRRTYLNAATGSAGC